MRGPWPQCPRDPDVGEREGWGKGLLLRRVIGTLTPGQNGTATWDGDQQEGLELNKPIWWEEVRYRGREGTLPRLLSLQYPLPPPPLAMEARPLGNDIASSPVELIKCNGSWFTSFLLR